MSLELVNTFGTLLTVAIIAATAIAAIVQLRHLRAGNQINAMLTIGNQVDNRREFQDAVTLVRQRLNLVLEELAYRDFELARQRRLPLPPVPEEYGELRAATTLVGHTYEELGILVKNNIVDRHMFLDQYGWNIARTWDAMRTWVAWTRAIAGTNTLLENFEYLTVLAEDWLQEHREGTYPVGARRLPLHNPYPVPPLPATS